eukprot:jgi/Chrzof1/2686/Cz11g25060.t1
MIGVSAKALKRVQPSAPSSAVHGRVDLETQQCILDSHRFTASGSAARLTPACNHTATACCLGFGQRCSCDFKSADSSSATCSNNNDYDATG